MLSYSCPAHASKCSSFSSNSQLFRYPINKNKKAPTSFSVRASASTNSSVVTLLDYGAGNVRSVRNAIHSLGFSIKDVESPKDILNAERLVFPGVGAFAAAMDFIHQNQMTEALCSYIENDRPFLGICLGLQLLFESSEEKGTVKGLSNII